jgi:hypothetical protein
MKTTDNHSLENKDLRTRIKVIKYQVSTQIVKKMVYTKML